MKRVNSSRTARNALTLACAAGMAFVCNIFADPLYVSLDSAQYITYVEAFQVTNDLDDTGVGVSRTATSPGPINDEIDLPVIAGQGAGLGITTHATANAGLFEVSDQTGWGFANAEAVSQIWFSPLADQTQILNITMYAASAAQSHAFTAGQVCLLDLTASSELWNYSWNECDSPFVPVPVPLDADDVPWDPDNCTANFSLGTDFLASHQYELTLITCSNAGDDSEAVQIQVTGLQAVPEPGPVVLFAIGSMTLAIYGARSCRHIRPQA